MTDCPQVYIVGTLVNANEEVAEATGAVLEVEAEIGRAPPVLSPAMMVGRKGRRTTREEFESADEAEAEKKKVCAVMG